MQYLVALDLIHRILIPTNYVEIGCRKGVSLALSQCPCIGIDPDFEICVASRSPTRLFRQTSDDFFATENLTELLGGPVDLAFVDGMHLAEFALRDVLNLEMHASPDAVVVIDDIMPQHIEWTSRERQTQAWTGDVYKVILFLRQYRPDLEIQIFDVEMKGMALITGFSPGDRSLLKDLQRHEESLKGSQFACVDMAELRQTLKPLHTRMLSDYLLMLKQRRRQKYQSTSNNIDAGALYLDLLKRSLLNEIYLDDEMRLLYLRDCIAQRDTFDYSVLHDIRDARAEEFAELKASRNIGRFPKRDISRSGFSHTMMGRQRLDSLHSCLDDLTIRGIPGDLIECGVWRGGGCIFMAGWLRAHAIQERKLIIADSFEGLPPPTYEQDGGLDLTKEKFPQLAVSRATVRENFATYGLLDDHMQVFLEGWFRNTLVNAPIQKIALLRLDGDLYESTMDILAALYDRVSPGGIVILDDYGALTMCRQAVEDYFAARGEPLPALSTIDWTGVFFVKPIL